MFDAIALFAFLAAIPIEIAALAWTATLVMPAPAVRESRAVPRALIDPAAVRCVLTGARSYEIVNRRTGKVCATGWYHDLTAIPAKTA